MVLKTIPRFEIVSEKSVDDEQESNAEENIIERDVVTDNLGQIGR